MTTQNLVETYKEFLRVQKQQSKHTISSYSLDIQQFFNIIESKNVTNVSNKTIQLYLIHLNKKKISPRSIHRKLSALKQFWKYLQSQKVVSNNPWLSIRTPKVKQKIPVYLEEQVMIELLNNYPIKTDIQVRNKTILELLFASGIRISECINLTIANITIDTLECRVIGKGGKERIALFGKRCAFWLQFYLENVHAKWKKSSLGPLFISKSGTQLTPKTIQRIVKAANQYHSSNIVITPHACRHSCASSLITNGANIRDIQELLGHSSIVTTQRYAHLPTKKLKQRFLEIMDT